MKTTLIAIGFSLLSFVSQAQSFEGVVKYKSTISGTEPANMLTKLMNKASSTLYIGKNGDVRLMVKLDEEIVDDFIYEAKKTFKVNHSKKQAKVLDPKFAGRTATFKKSKIKPLNEIDTILGYPCNKYELITESSNFLTGEIKLDTSIVWSTLSIPISNEVKKAYHFGKFHDLPGFVIKEIKGNSKATTELLITEIIFGLPDSTLLQIPEGYKVNEFKPLTID